MGKRREQEEFTAWLVLAIMPVVVLTALSYLLGVNYRDRYFLVGMPAVILLVLWGWQRYSRLLRWVGFISILLTSSYLSWQVFTTGAYQRSDWQNVTDYVVDHYQPGDVIFFERSIVRETFSFYVQDNPELLEHSFVVDNNNADAFADAHHSKRIWVIYRIRHEDLHRQGWVQQVNPFMSQLSPLSDWLQKQRSAILTTSYFDGVFVFLMAG